MKLRTKRAIGVALFAVSLMALTRAVWAAETPAPAEIVFVNGKVFTADARDHVFQALAVTGDRWPRGLSRAGLRVDRDISNPSAGSAGGKSPARHRLSESLQIEL
jgi:hypothetical protein